MTNGARRAATTVKLVVGLGNPGREYDGTRHNAGFVVVDEVARRAGLEFRRGWLSSARQAKGEIGGADVVLAKPQTFMNRSGDAVAPLLRKKGLEPADMIVVFDDVELDAGTVRVRRSGGAGGHNGLESVIERLGTGEFVRVRVGVGPRPAGQDLVRYVLGKFSPDERKRMAEAVERAADAVECILREGVDRAMNRFNQKQGEGGQS